MTYDDATRHRAGKISERFAWVIIVVILLGVLLGKWYYDTSKSQIILLPKGKAEFYRAGFFHRDRFPIKYYRGEWTFALGQNLLLPFECKYYGPRNLRFEANGKVYLVNRKELTREELRIVNGEWSYDAGDHWQSIFDLDIEPDRSEL